MIDKHYYKWDEEEQICIGYIRHGECKQCGACCRAHIACLTPNELTLWKGIWCEVALGNERIFFKTTEIVLESDHCKGLDKDNLCEDHGENKAFCAEWPFNPTDLEHFPDCGYSFEEDGKWTYEEIEEKTE